MTDIVPRGNYSKADELLMELGFPAQTRQEERFLAIQRMIDPAEKGLFVARLTVNVGEMARMLDIGRNQAYALCKTPGFPCIQIGKRMIIPVDGLHEWLQRQAQGRDAE